ncbi:MAG: hypothetical protein IJ829_03665 [Kiritimatiellae bacterium]|nr:hypothetical protein [Kiritimatiellia bacterium]
MNKRIAIYCMLVGGLAVRECAAVQSAPISLLLGDTIAYSPEEDVAECMATLSSHDPGETNEIMRARQQSAIRTLARVGSTNCIERLSQIWKTDGDYARLDACDAALVIAARLDLADVLTSIAGEIATNGTPFKAFSDGHREALCRKHVYRKLIAIYLGGAGNDYRACPADVQDAIRAFLYDRAGKEQGEAGIYLDIKLTSAISAYRHSQCRRDNLAQLQSGISEERLLRIVRKAQQDAAQTD